MYFVCLDGLSQFRISHDNLIFQVAEIESLTVCIYSYVRMCDHIFYNMKRGLKTSTLQISIDKLPSTWHCMNGSLVQWYKTLSTKGLWVLYYKVKLLYYYEKTHIDRCSCSFWHWIHTELSVSLSPIYTTPLKALCPCSAAVYSSAVCYFNHYLLHTCPDYPSLVVYCSRSRTLCSSFNS